MKLTVNQLMMLFFVVLLGGCTSFESRLQKAQKQFDDKSFVEAVDNLNAALAEWKESDGVDQKGEAYQLLGRAYHAIGNLDRASEAYTQAITVSNKTYDAAYQLGMIALTSKESQKALFAFRKALQIKPDDPHSLIGLGNTYFDTRDYSNALQMYERILDTSPGVRDALQYSAITRQRMSLRVKKPAPARPAVVSKKKAPAPKKPTKKKR